MKENIAGSVDETDVTVFYERVSLTYLHANVDYWPEAQGIIPGWAHELPVQLEHPVC